MLNDWATFAYFTFYVCVSQSFGDKKNVTQLWSPDPVIGGHYVLLFFIASDKGGGKCVCPCLSVCLLCLLARLLKNTCMDLAEMLRVNRCRDMDELINL